MGVDGGGRPQSHRVANLPHGRGIALFLYAGGNIVVYTGENAGELKVPRVMSLVSCYSDDEGETWEGYQNITHMVKEENQLLKVDLQSSYILSHTCAQALLPPSSLARLAVTICLRLSRATCCAAPLMCHYLPEAQPA